MIWRGGFLGTSGESGVTRLLLLFSNPGKCPNRGLSFQKIKKIKQWVISINPDILSECVLGAETDSSKGRKAY